MTRILFVDDEPVVLRALSRALRTKRTSWQATFVGSAAEALDVLAQQPFDVIVSDIAMPDMDGVTLLRAVRSQYPHIARLALSGEARTEDRMRAVVTIHQWLAKPCPLAQLLETIDSLRWARGLVDDDETARAALGMSMLPSAPPLYLALAEAFERHAPLHEVATLIQSDPAITAKLLQLVNSSFFVDAERVTCVRRAAEKLGAQRLRELLLAAELFQGSPAAAATATHGLRVARLARGLAPAFADDAYLAGLLHDVGRLVLDAPAGATETFHARVGGVLLGVWGLPIEVVRAVAFHHDPDASPDPTDPRLRAVALAEALVGEIEDPTLPRAIVEQRSAALGVSPDEVRARALAS